MTTTRLQRHLQRNAFVFSKVVRYETHAILENFDLSARPSKMLAPGSVFTTQNISVNGHVAQECTRRVSYTLQTAASTARLLTHQTSARFFYKLSSLTRSFPLFFFILTLLECGRS